MKKHLFLFSLFFVTYYSYGQGNTFPSNGNVGVGTTTPNIWFSGKTLELRDSRPIIRLSPTADGEVGTIAFKGAWGSATASTPDEFHLNYVSSSTNPRLVLVGYYGNTYNQLLTIKGNGNIGVGTETPTDRLSVNGKIRAHEIKVETANWPDYVFAKGYQLPSLKETEQHINEKGHLPGIPSAEEVKANGVDLGDMNAKLLQKIEELTLYLIEIKRDNESEKLKALEQKKIIDQQQKDIEQLKSKLK
nr:hypothetical protein [Pedobacter panaciterrae]